MEEYNTSVMECIKFCADSVTSSKIIRVFPNQKPWMNSEVQRLLKARDAAYCTKDAATYVYKKIIHQCQ